MLSFRSEYVHLGAFLCQSRDEEFAVEHAKPSCACVLCIRDWGLIEVVV
jgi:hypothetical protein